MSSEENKEDPICQMPLLTAKKTGRLAAIFPISIEVYQELEDDQAGMCLRCGHDRGCCEPDASGYECDACGERAVLGTMNLLASGYVE